MLNLLSLTVILPLLGAGGIFLGSLVFTKLDVEEGRFWTFVAALAVAAVAFASVLVLKGRGGATALLSSSRPALLAESVARFHLDPALWPLAVALSLVTCSVLLAELGRTSSNPLRLTALVLALLAAGLAALWSANPLTTLVGWVLYDLFFLLGQLTVGAGTKEAVRALALGSVASLLLWAGVLVAGNGTGSVQWSLMPAGGPKMTFWMLAGLLRLGAYPLHLSTPSRVDASSPLVTTLFLSPVLGWGLWGRLALANDGLLPVGTWVMIPALLTLVAGGVLAWTARSSRDALPWIGMGANGAVLFSSVLASLPGGQGTGENAALAILALGVTSWMLGMTALFLGNGLALPQALRRSALSLLPSLVGALSLIGAPITLGFAAASYLMGDLVRLGQWSWTAGFFAGQTFLVAAVVRWLIPVTQPEELDVRSLGQLAPAAGWLGSALLLIAGGLVPNLLCGSSGLSLWHLLTRPSLVGWLLWGGAFLLGGVLAWHDADLRPRVSLWLDALHDVVRLDWAWDLLIDAVDRGLSIVRVADDILGGRGALLWSFIILLILMLVWRAR
jgi:hypothetical protein